MTDTMKRMLGVGAGVLAALAAGWAWGVTGKGDTARALRAAELRDDLHAGRAAVLDARLDIYNVNFGDASRHLEQARTAVRAASARLQAMGRDEDAARLQPALTAIDEAQQMAGRLNQDANARAAVAARAIGDVLTSGPPR